jgi:endonuclease/exonuclease/phosphatase family metal-dependent hydrolase
MKSFDDLHRMLKHYSIILLQECFDETFESLEGYFPDYHICRGALKGINIMNSGLVILSKFPIIDVQFYLYKQSNPLTFDIFSEKGILSAQIEINNRKIYVMNTHLQSCDFYRYDRYAILQLEELKQYITHLRLRDEKYIVGGDFNIDIQDFTRMIKNEMPKSENIYYPDDPTIFIDFFTSHTRSQPEKGYDPLIFDYFISTIDLDKPVTIPSEYSDHNPVRAFFQI